VIPTPQVAEAEKSLDRDAKGHQQPADHNCVCVVTANVLHAVPSFASLNPSFSISHRLLAMLNSAWLLTAFVKQFVSQ
jgi:hypothetical protein